MILGWLLICAALVVALTLIAVGLVSYIARTRAVMAGGFVSHGKRYIVVEVPERECWPEAEIAGEIYFRSGLDDYLDENGDRWRGTAHR